MRHPMASAVPILDVARALGLGVTGRAARCFNRSEHRRGTDATPSLTFFLDANRFKCYACRLRGDSIDLVQMVRGVGFREAVDWLRKLSTPGRGVAPPGALPPARRAPGDAARAVYGRLYQLSHYPVADSPGGAYLLGRGIPPDLARDCGVAELDDPRRIWAELQAEFPAADLEAAGLVTRGGHFLFGRHTLLLNFFDGGRPQYVMARDVTGDARRKELAPANLCCPVPYLVDVLRPPPQGVFVCEGCIDTLSAIRMGYKAVGVPGVTGFRDEWFPLFRGVDIVTVAFDDDEAGRRQAAELRDQFRLRGKLAYARFPTRGDDINDLLRNTDPGDKP